MAEIPSLADPADCDIERPSLILRRRLPLAWVDFHAPLTDEDFAWYLAFLDGILELETRHVTVLRTHPGAGIMSADHRRQSSEWIHDRAPSIENWSAGLGLVFENTAQRFVLSTILLVTRMPTAYKVCGTDEEVLAWASDLVGHPGLERPVDLG